MTQDPDEGVERPTERDAEDDDTQGQALTWKVRKPIPQVEEDVEGHGFRPPPEQSGPSLPLLEEGEPE